MPEILAPSVLTHRGETTAEDTAVQAHRIAASVWQTLVRERQQRMPVLAAPVQISQVVLTHPDKDHIHTLQAVRNTLAHGMLHANWLFICDSTAELGETGEDLEATGESFRKLAESLSKAQTSVLVAFTRATSETSTFIGSREAVHYRTTLRAPSEREWTEEKNQRRCHLVDKEIDGTISPVEKVELARLQAEMLAYRRKVAPLPLEDLRKLHQELLRQASHKTTE